MQRAMPVFSTVCGLKWKGFVKLTFQGQERATLSAIKRLEGERFRARFAWRHLEVLDGVLKGSVTNFPWIFQRFDLAIDLC
jgi:hypothetical protein